MEALKILEKSSDLRWSYDEGADVLYLSVGAPRAADGIDLGDGLILRYDDERDEVAGLTIIGLGRRLTEALADED